MEERHWPWSEGEFWAALREGKPFAVKTRLPLPLLDEPSSVPRCDSETRFLPADSGLPRVCDFGGRREDRDREEALKQTHGVDLGRGQSGQPWCSLSLRALSLPRRENFLPRALTNGNMQQGPAPVKSAWC